MKTDLVITPDEGAKNTSYHIGIGESIFSYGIFSNHTVNKVVSMDLNLEPIELASAARSCRIQIFKNKLILYKLRAAGKHIYDIKMDGETFLSKLREAVFFKEKISEKVYFDRIE